uniref:phage portal protein n=1 Tax=Enterocloster aldenensis TaxID=358742 RepID=UPI0022DFF45F
MSKRRSTRHVRADTKQAPVTTMDAFSNPIARLGYGTQDLLQATQYPLTRMTQNYQLLTSLYRENWIVQNIIETIPGDMVRKWYTLKCNVGPEYVDALQRLERKVHLRKSLLEGMYWGRLYGGAAGIIMIRGQDDLTQPLDYELILPGCFLGLMILDRWSGIYPEFGQVTDPADPDFELPEYYTIRDEESGTLISKVHHSRVLRFTGRELPYNEKIVETYWGESELEAIYSELVKRDNVSGNIAALTFRANVNYLETDSLDQMLAVNNAAAQKRFWQTLQAQSVIESNFGTRLVNKGDVMHNTQYTFAGLADVYDRVMMDVAGAAKTPVTKLFGRSPAGMNATGESDMNNYYDYIDGLRENQLRPILERLLPIMALSAWGIVPYDLDIDFPPLQTPDSNEVADIVDKKTQAVLSAYQSDLIDAATALKELKALADETSMYNSISDEAIEQAKGRTYSDYKAMQDPLAGLTLPGSFGMEEGDG